jgi:hypothetical protein
MTIAIVCLMLLGYLLICTVCARFVSHSMLLYSLRNASTGSLRLAAEDGIKPATNVSTTLIRININAAPTGNMAMFSTS